jgi:aminoglycoside phosphotransferase (APT) family kinase protein
LDGIINVEHVPKGASTYVYRVISRSGTYYLRFLPEDGSFAAEVLAHNTMRAAGVNVPRLIGFEHRNEHTGLSVMLVEEIPGMCIEDDRPQANLRDILQEAGRQLARIHGIPVEMLPVRLHDRHRGLLKMRSGHVPHAFHGRDNR